MIEHCIYLLVTTDMPHAEILGRRKPDRAFPQAVVPLLGKRNPCREGCAASAARGRSSPENAVRSLSCECPHPACGQTRGTSYCGTIVVVQYAHAVMILLVPVYVL